MDIKKAIEKLNSIDAKDLKNIDLSKLKEYDLARIKEELLTKPKLFLNSFFILIAVIVVFYNFSVYKKESSVINAEITQLEEKLAILKKTKKSEEEYNTFFVDFPETIPDTRLIGKLSEFAEEAGINILSFSPVSTKETDYVKLNIVNLSIQASNYKNLIKFFDIIENSPYTLRVNKWDIQTRNLNLSNFKGVEEVPLYVSIEIGSILFEDA